MPRKGKKRLAVDLPERVHKTIFELSKKYGMTLTNFLLMIIAERLKQEEYWDNEKYL